MSQPELSNSSSLADTYSSNFSSFNCTHHVFLSFRGEDTRSGFTRDLYGALSERGIQTFMDDVELRKGEEIEPSLLKAIEESWIAIVVLSKNYATSTFCLRELVKILECAKEKGRLVLPIFYGVNPSDVRHLKESYGEAFTKHEARFEKDKVKMWKRALQKVSNLSGWHLQGSEYKVIREIVEEVSRKTQHIILHVANYPVGLEFQIKKLRSFLDFESKERVIMVGIYGIGGIGKTTIARAMYNCIADQFAVACFLANVRERSNQNDGLVQLQEQLLSELAGRNNIKLTDVNRGIPILKQTLNKKKVLLILDDVDKLCQLQTIVGGPDWFGSGSIIIITTRDEHLLDAHGVKRKYMMEALNDEEAFKLFTWNAFKGNEIDDSYQHILNKFLKYCNGLPLALEVIGSDLFGRELDEWESALDTYKKVPNRDIQEVLRVSYDHLTENEKEVFLDIACFYRGCKLEYIKERLQICHDLRSEFIIRVLVERSLIKICLNYVTMHDLIQDMGRDIVRQESPKNPSKRSRLWCYEDIRDVFEGDEGTDEIQAIMLNAPRNSKVEWDGNALSKMKNLRILVVKNTCFSCGPNHLPNSLKILDWEQYPSSSLPSKFNPRKLTILNLNRSSHISLDKPFQHFEALSEINLSNSNLERVPCVSGAPNLRKIILDRCTELVEVHGSIGLLDKLETLSAIGCSNVRVFPEVIHSTSLKKLDLTGCLSLSNFPEILRSVELKTINLRLGGGSEDKALRLLQLSETFPYILDSGHLMYLKVDKIIKGSFGHIGEGEDQYHVREITSFPQKVTRLYIRLYCARDKYLWKWLPCFPNLEILSLYCHAKVDLRNKYWTDEFLSTHLPCFPNLQSLNLSGNNFTILPECINECHYLRRLNLDDCKQLREIRGVPPCIEILSAINCISLSDQSKRLLTSQALHEARPREFTLPGVTVPEWFASKQPQQSLSFWVCKEFPEEIALCCVYKGLDKGRPYIHLLVNGFRHDSVYYPDDSLHYPDDSDDSFYYPDDSVYYPVLQPPRAHKNVVLRLNRLRLSTIREVDIRPGWNHVQLLVKEDYDCQIVSWMGVHIYKKGNSTENVRFTDPDPGKGKAGHLSGTYNNHAFHLDKEWCTFLDKKVLNTEYAYWRPNPVWEVLRKIQAPIEVKILMCKINQNALPTCSKLFGRKVIDSPLCPICKTDYETIEHVFRFCEWTRPVWFGSDLQWCVDGEYDWDFELTDWILSKIRGRVHANVHNFPYSVLELSEHRMDDVIVEGQPFYKIMGTVGNICWAIWKGRNEYVVGSKPVDPQLALSRIKALSKQYSYSYPLVQTATTSQEEDNKAKGKSALMALSNNDTEENTGQEGLSSDHSVTWDAKITRSTSDKEQVREPRSKIETLDSMIMDTVIHNEQVRERIQRKTNVETTEGETSDSIMMGTAIQNNQLSGQRKKRKGNSSKCISVRSCKKPRVDKGKSNISCKRNPMHLCLSRQLLQQYKPVFRKGTLLRTSSLNRNERT